LGGEKAGKVGRGAANKVHFVIAVAKVRTSRSTRSCGAFRFHLKKTLRAAEQDRPDVAAARAELIAEQPGLDVRRLY
jgi:hypothetical protein